MSKETPLSQRIGGDEDEPGQPHRHAIDEPGLTIMAMGESRHGEISLVNGEGQKVGPYTAIAINGRSLDGKERLASVLLIEDSDDLLSLLYTITSLMEPELRSQVEKLVESWGSDD